MRIRFCSPTNQKLIDSKRNPAANVGTKNNVMVATVLLIPRTMEAVGAVYRIIPTVATHANVAKANARQINALR